MKKTTAAVLSSLVTLTIFVALPAAAQESSPRAAPANDNFGQYTIINARDAMKREVTVSSVQDATVQGGMSPEPDPSCTAGTINHTVWFRIEAPYEIHLVVDTFESSLNNGASNNTVIAAYTSSGAGFAGLNEQYCSAGGAGSGSFTWVPLPAGNHYLQVGSEISLTSASTYKVKFGSRYQLISNTGFGEDVAVLAPWTVVNKSGDKVMCDGGSPRVVDLCSFRFKTGAGENSSLNYVHSDAAGLPHDAGPVYSEFHLDIDYYTERTQTDAKAILKVKFQDGTVEKDTRILDLVGAIYVDPDTGATPSKVKVIIRHTGTSGKPLYITQVRLFYAPGATGREAVAGALPLAVPAQ